MELQNLSSPQKRIVTATKILGKRKNAILKIYKAQQWAFAFYNNKLIPKNNGKI
jgi:hypothetical protein